MDTANTSIGMVVLLPKGAISDESVIWESSVLIIILLVGGFNNGAILYYNILHKGIKKVKPLEVLVLNSALADFFMCAFYIPLQLPGLIMKSWTLGSSMCISQLLILIQTLGVSVGSNLLIAFFCSLKCLSKKPITFTKKMMVLWVACLWMYVFIIVQIPVLVGNIHVRFDDQILYICWADVSEVSSYRSWIYISMFLCIYLPMVMTGLSYLMIYVKHRFFNHTETTLNIPTNTSKMLRSMFGLFMLFMVCWCPTTLAVLIDVKYVWPPILHRSFSYLKMVNGALNPFYYMYRVRGIIPKFWGASVAPQSQQENRTGEVHQTT